MTKLKIYNHIESPQAKLESDLPLEISELLDDAGIIYFKVDKNDVLLAVHDEQSASKLFSYLKTVIPEMDLEYFDMVSLGDAQVNYGRVRLKYLSEHTLEQPEAYVNIDGRFVIFFHLEDQVYELLCERGDFILLPSGIKHWIDFGSHGGLTAMKMTRDEDMPAIIYTGSNIADRFPKLA